MRTLQEKYNAIQEGKFSKDHFLAEARMQQPQLITRFNGYDDAVQILKNKGMIVEAAKETVKEDYSRVLELPDGNYFAIDGDWEDEYQGKNGMFFTIDGYDIYDKDGESIQSSPREFLSQFKPEEILKVESVNEARLTKNNLTDYRYKPTNEMDKYPYEQILRGIRVELETMGVQATPTAEEYAKALAKVSKNLAKDSIFYTNQVAGVNPKVELHDKMVNITAKNTVDTFNGMKKVKNLKESHTGNPKDKYVVRPCKNKKEPWAVWEGEERVKGFATKEEAKEYADKKNKKQGLSESVLKEGFKKLIRKILSEASNDLVDLYDDQERADNTGEEEYEFYSDPENYNEEDDLQEGPAINNPKIEKLVDGINQLILQAKDSDGDPIGVVEPGGTWDEPVMYSPIEYRNGALKITTKSPYRAGSSTDVILARNMEYDGIPTLRLILRMYKKAVKKALMENEENIYELYADQEEEDDVPHPPGYEEATDEESFEDLFESKSLKELL